MLWEFILFCELLLFCAFVLFCVFVLFSVFSLFCVFLSFLVFFLFREFILFCAFLLFCVFLSFCALLFFCVLLWFCVFLLFVYSNFETIPERGCSASIKSSKSEGVVYQQRKMIFRFFLNVSGTVGDKNGGGHSPGFRLHTKTLGLRSLW